MQHRRNLTWAFGLGFLLLVSLTLGNTIFPAQAATPSATDPILQLTPGSNVACVNTTPDGSGCGASCGECFNNVQTAVDAVPSGGTVRIAQGTYTGSGSAVVNVTKQLRLEGGYDASCTSATGGVTVLDGEWLRTVVEVEAIGPVELYTLTLTHGTGKGNCDTSASQYGGCGGGLYVLDTPVIVNSCRFENNLGSAIGSGAGGGAFVLNAISGEYAQFINCTFVNNVANTFDVGVGWGGGLYLDSGTQQGPSHITDCTLMDNTGSNKNEGYGGGAYIAGYAEVVNNVFVNNYAGRDTAKYGWGGALYLWQTKRLDLMNNTLSANVAAQNPGSENFNAAGGAIFASTNISLTAINNIIVNNEARDEGTAIYFESFTSNPVNAWFYHNTIVGNKGNSDSGAVTLQYVVGDVHTVFTNNIIAGHQYGIDNKNPVHNDVSGEKNLLWNANNGTTGNFPVIAEPKLTPDYHPQLGSAVIQAGLLLPPATHFWIAFDKDGNTRPQGTLPNIGAYETHRNAIHLPVVLRR